MGISGIFEILYSPVNALRKIINNPDFKGILVILALVMLSMALVQYIAASKNLIFFDARIPPNEKWTESTTFWTSNSNLSLDNDSKVGDNSIRSHTLNGTSLILSTSNIEPVKVFENTGYKELNFWIKWIHENEEFPTNTTLRLFFANQSYTPEIDLASSISSISGKWSNVSIPLDLERQNWDSLDSNLKNITGLEFRLVWSTPNSTMKLDDIYFRNYVSPIEIGVTGIIVESLINTAISFSMNWILWAVILLMVAKIFHEEVGPWTTFFMIIGYIFSVTVVYNLISATLLSTLPALNLQSKAPYEMLSPFIVYQLWPYLSLVWEIWIAGLCAITLRLMRDLTWGKAGSISIVAFILRLILKLFFGF